MNSFGTLFRVSLFGESHGPAIGVTLDGVPAGIEFSGADMETDIVRRKPGASGTTPRVESDMPEILSGMFNGRTTGSPLTVIFRNSNTRSGDYESLKTHPRPGHADFTAMKKYRGFNDYRGGGHFSGRMTLAVVAAGSIAKKVVPAMEISSEIVEIGGVKDYAGVLDEAIKSGDSLGGIVQVKIKGLPCGLGEPFFNSFESVLSHLLFSIPAVKGVEFGAGFNAARMKGSENNDLIISPDGKTATNNTGGINGGITNGNEIIFRVAVKPTPSISIPQKTLNIKSGSAENLEIRGRHDACVTLRTPVVFEACAAIASADMYLINKAYI
ncbi:MAG TPA: chorismate synthase [Spirochaetota bacterium]|nr:chorismate synthase [Spirochaetota bacterium]